MRAPGVELNSSPTIATTAMPVSTVVFDGDASGAVAAAKETQAAIDGVHGKTVDIEVNTRGAGPSAAILDAIGERGGRAADSLDRMGRSADRTNDSLGAHARAHDRASASAREHASASDRVNESMAGMRDYSDRNSDSLGRTADAHERASDAAERHMTLINGMGRARNFDDMWKAAEGQSFPGFAPTSAELPGMSGIERSPLFDRRAEVSARGAASGVRDVRREMEELGSSSERDGGGVIRVLDEAGRTVRGLGDGFRGATSPLRSSSEGLLGLSSDFNEVTETASIAGRAMGTVGMAAAYSAVGMGVLAGATAAVGVGAGIADIMKSKPMMDEVRRTARLAENAFSDMGGKAADVGLGPMKALETGVVGVSKQLAQLGVSHLPETLGAASNVVDQFGGMVRGLEPAISPAVRGFTALSGAVMGGLGQSAPAITNFANTVSANADGIQSLVHATVAGAGVLGESFTNALGAWGPRLQAMEPMFAGAGDFLSGLAFAPSNMEDRSSSTSAALNKAGYAVAGGGIGGFLGGVAGGLIGLAGGPVGVLGGAAIGSSIGAGAGLGAAYLDDKVASQSPEMQAGIKAHATYNTGATAPLYPLSKDSDPTRSSEPTVQRAVAAASGAAPPPLPVGSTAAPSLPASSPSLLPSLPRSVGESGPGLSGTTGQLAALNQEMARSTNMSPLLSQGMQNLGSSAQQSMQQVGGAAQSAAPQFSQGLQGMQQHAQQLPQQIGSAMSMLAPAIQQPLSQIAPAAAQAIQPEPMAQAAGAAVTKAVTQVQPQAEQGGQDMGASVPSGFGQGVTKDIDKVVTIVEHMITKVIKAGADGLQTASPSRIFDAFGRSVPEGLAQGIEAQQSVAVTATQGLIGQMTATGAQQLNSGMQQHQNDIAQQQQQIQNQQQQMAQQAVQKQQELGAAFPLQQQGQAQAAKAAADQAEEIRRAQQTGDFSRLSPQARQQMEQAQQQANLHQYQDGRTFDKNRYDQLSKLGYGENTLERIQDREDRHNKTADEHKDQRRKNHIDALMRGGSEESVRNKLMHEFGEHGKAVGNGTADGIKNSSGAAKSGVADMVNGLIDQSKKRLAISSPSKVFAGIGGDTAAGMAEGMSSAITGASNVAGGVASDRGLQVGYRWATSMATGIQSVFKSADFQASAVPQVQNDQAKSVLGQLGLLGAAGSGAMVYKNQEVSFSGGSTSQSFSPSFEVHVQVGDQPVQVVAARVVQQHFEALADQVGLQVG